MVAPVDQALAVGAAQDLDALLQLDEGLGRDGDVAARADAGVHVHDDRVFQARTDEFVALEDGLGHGGAGFGAAGVEFGKARLGHGDAFVQALAGDGQFGVESGRLLVDGLELQVLAGQFLGDGDLFLFAAAVLLLQVVHLAHHRVIFLGVANLHHLTLALFEPHGVGFDLAFQALLLVGQVLEFVANDRGIVFDFLAALFQFGYAQGGLFEFVLEQDDLVIHFLQDHQLFDLFQIHGILRMVIRFPGAGPLGGRTPKTGRFRGKSARQGLSAQGLRQGPRRSGAASPLRG